jgi:hypothetical protein
MSATRPGEPQQKGIVQSPLMMKALIRNEQTEPYV